ncbi:MAG: ATP-binding protein [Chloroflexales bacterium]
MKLSINLTQKLIVFLLLASIIPVLIVGISAYQVSRTIVQDESKRYAAELVQQQQEYLALNLNQIESLITNISHVEAIIQALAHEPAPDDAYTRLVTQARIGDILDGYSSLSGLVSLDIFALGGSHYHVGDTLDGSNIRDDVRDRLVLRARTLGPAEVWAGVEDNVNKASSTRKVVSVARMLSVTDRGSPQTRPVAALLVNYDIGYLYTHFTRIDLGEGAALIVTDADSHIVYHPDTQMIGATLNSSLQRMLHDTHGTFTTTMDGQEEMLVSYSRLDTWNWAVITLVPVNTLAARASPIGLVVFLALLIAFTIVGVTALIASSTIVAPLRHLTQRFQLYQSGTPDWQVPLVVRGQDEIAELSRWFNLFSESLLARQQADVALKQSEERYRVIFEGASEGIVTVHEEDRSFLFTNPVMSALFGYTHDEFLSLVVSDLHPSETLPYVLTEFEALARGEKMLATNIPCARKNGSVFYADVKVARVHLDNQDVLVGLFNDITERLQAEVALIAERNSLARRVEERTADLSQVNAELSRAVRAKDEFVANMSHELRTPLNAILGLSESLLEQVRGPLNERQQQSLRNIEISGRHLLSLINDILDLAKVESGQMDLQLDSIEITGLCQASLMFVKEQANKKHLHLEYRVDDLQAVMHADAKRLKQMLVNLLSNAVKFTEAGGRVSLEVQTNTEAGVVRFVVEDTGIGMNPEEMGRLFQPFVQLDSRLNRQHEGTGLGLALVRRFAELHGGGVTVESELGQGSRFTIALPYVSRKMMAQNPADHALIVGDNALRAVPVIENTKSVRKSPIIPPYEPPPTGVRVLIVEDNTINITTVGDYLRDRGYQVKVARTGREALDIVAEARPDVILMDIQMAEMDGLETTRLLRAMPNYQDTPIIAMTALAMPGDREQCLVAGANEYLTKPVRLKGLVETMQRLLTSA